MSRSRRSVLATGAAGAYALTAGCLDFVLGDGPLEFEAGLATPTAEALDRTGYEEAAVENEGFDETVEFGVEREVRASFWIATYTKEPSLDQVDPEDLAEAVGDDADLDVDEGDLEDADADQEGFDEDDLEDVDLDEDELRRALEEGELNGDGSDEESTDESDEGADDGDESDAGDELDPSDIDPDRLEAGEYGEMTFAAISTPGVEVAGRSLNPLEGMETDELLDEFTGEVEGDLENLEYEGTISLEILGASREVDRYVGEASQGEQSVPIEVTIASFGHEDDHLVLLGVYPQPFEEEAENVEILMESIEHPLDA